MMPMNNQTAIALLVATELVVEFIADTVEYGLKYGLGHLHWQNAPPVFDIVFCTGMMLSIVVAIALLDPKSIDHNVLAVAKTVAKKLKGYATALKSRIKRKPKSTV